MASLQELEAELARRQSAKPAVAKPPASNLQALEAELARRQALAQKPVDQAASAEPSVHRSSSNRQRKGVADRKRAEAEALITQDQLARYKVGELTSQDVTPEEITKIQQARIAEIPEITGSFRNLSKNLGLTQALAGMTAFDPDEFGKILQASDPDIGVVTTPEGERLAVNRRTNEVMSINKTGPSLMDALQIGGAVAAFTPAGAAKSIARQALGAALTQAAIETGQAAVGGDFNPTDVAIAGAAVPVVAGVLKYGKGAIENFRRSVRGNTNLIDEATGLPTKALDRALNKRGLDAGDLLESADELPAIYTANTPEEYVDMLVKRQINSGSKANYIAKVRLDNKGEIVPDDLGREALKQGFKAGDITAAKQENQQTRKAMQKMLRMQRSIVADSSKVDKFRPSDVAGDAVMDRFRFVRNQADKLRDQLHKMASKELSTSGRKLIGESGKLKGMEINPSGIERAVFDGLEKLNVQARGEAPIFEAIKSKGFFEGSQISKDKTSQRVIRDVIDLLSEPGKIDALRAHNVKHQLDALIDFNKKSAQGLTEAGRNFAKSIRHQLNESIREVSPKYARINDDLSVAIRAMEGLEEALPGKVDLFAPNAHQAVGTELRKLLSNYGTRQILNNSLNTLDDVASGLGGKFDVNFKALNRFANTLDNRLGSVATNSFKGNIDAAFDLNRLRSTSAKEFAIEKGFEKLQSLRGLSDKAAMDAMQKLLVRGK